MYRGRKTEEIELGHILNRAQRATAAAASQAVPADRDLDPPITQYT
jgi:hypothetical protein